MRIDWNEHPERRPKPWNVARRFALRRAAVVSETIANPVITVTVELELSNSNGDSKTYTGTGGATCHWRDVFDERLGLRMAYGRACKAIARQMIRDGWRPEDDAAHA